MRAVLLAVITFYRKAISPWTGRHCRYEPTCSVYAYEAISRYGALKGFRLAVRRVAHCHPWAPGGFDPVPEDLSKTGRVA